MNNKRFVKISEREDRCDIPKSAWRPLTENAYLQTWKGLILAQDIMQVSLLRRIKICSTNHTFYIGSS